MTQNCTITFPSRKRGARRGFSLTELLLCALILSLSTTVISSTLDLGAQTFRKTTRRSEQILLCNTLSVSVQEYLTYAELVQPTAGGGLGNFKTNAMSALKGAACSLEALTYQNGEYREPTGTDDPTEIVLSITREGQTTLYPLLDRSQYIIRSNAAPALSANVAVKVFPTEKQFSVKVTVVNREGGVADVTNEFIVSPVRVMNWNWSGS